MASIFTKIINGEIPSYKIAEDDNFYAFLDINPVVKGHALVIPKKEIDYIFDLDNELLAGLNIFSKNIAKAIEKSVDCKRIATAVVGLEVPHAHLHLIPINKMSEFSFVNPKLKFTHEEFSNLLVKIKQNLS
ncbi:MAG: HIT family protein [Bacteroidales bacterium]|nr:HIT family protein [Bacteroidales bacterium]